MVIDLDNNPHTTNDPQGPEGTNTLTSSFLSRPKVDNFWDEDLDSSSGEGIDDLPSPLYITKSPYSPKIRRELQQAIKTYTLVAYESSASLRDFSPTKDPILILRLARKRQMALEILPLDTVEATRASILRLLMDNEVGEEWLYDTTEFTIEVKRVDLTEFHLKLEEMSSLRRFGKGLSKEAITKCILPSPVSSREQRPLNLNFPSIDDVETPDPSAPSAPEFVYPSSSI